MSHGLLGLSGSANRRTFVAWEQSLFEMSQYHSHYAGKSGFSRTPSKLKRILCCLHDRKLKAFVKQEKENFATVAMLSTTF